jgi:ribosomal protein S18 acetylase RimI-like enzyme
VNLRAAGTEDITALAALARHIYAEAFGPSFDAADLAAHLGTNLSDAYFRQAWEEDVFLLAEAEGRLIGFVQFGPLRIAVPAPSPEDQELRRLYVEAGFRNRGIGRRLLEAALAHPRLQRAARVFLDVWEQNQGARRLYQSYGFRVIGGHGLATASGTAPDQDLIMLRCCGIS